MSYFNGPANPDDFEDGIVEQESSRSTRAKLNIGIFLLIMGVLGSTVAANISLSDICQLLLQLQCMTD